MSKYRKKPVVIDAIQWTGDNITELRTSFPNFFYKSALIGREPAPTLVIYTLEGAMTASIGDYIIMGVDGEFYPCKPSIFEKTYEKVED